MAWWLDRQFRMIQNNIRDIDPKLIDGDRLMENLKDMGANVLQINCGGVTAFYDTHLDCQIKSPYMDGDFFGEVVKKCRENHIKVIARFDFNRVHKRFVDTHPEWFCRRADGSFVYSGDTALTCTSGPYQRQCSLAMIEEVLRTYPVDGIFFNHFGYIQWAYSGKGPGSCQCKNCRTAFRRMYGCELPGEDDETDPAHHLYEDFKERMVNSLLDDIRSLVKSINPECAVSTYTAHDMDIVRSESNFSLRRELPFWIYCSCDNAGRIQGSFDDKIASNCAINAVDFPSRFMGVAPVLTELRLYGNIACGGVPDWCINGGFEEYPDKSGFEAVKRVFTFHKKYEEYYGSLSSKSRIMVVAPAEDPVKVPGEYRGLFKMLKEKHIQFTIVLEEQLEAKISCLDEYDFILLPQIRHISGAVREALSKTRASVVASGGSLWEDKTALMDIFGVKSVGDWRETSGNYMEMEPRDIFEDFAEKRQRWVFLDGKRGRIETDCTARGILRKVEKAPFGPPEKCFGNKVMEENLIAISEKGNIYIPFELGTMYYRYGFEEFKSILFDVMKAVREIPVDIETDAPDMVEIFFSPCKEDTYMLQFINMTGFNGTTFFQPLAVGDMEVRFKTVTPVSIEEMTKDGLRACGAGREMRCSMGRGELYKAFLIHV